MNHGMMWDGLTVVFKEQVGCDPTLATEYKPPAGHEGSDVS